MIQPNDIHTLTEFKRNADGVVEHIAQSGRPHVLTVEGSPRFVVQEAAAYQELVEELEALRARAPMATSASRGASSGGKR